MGLPMTAGPEMHPKFHRSRGCLTYLLSPKNISLIKFKGTRLSVCTTSSIQRLVPISSAPWRGKTTITRRRATAAAFFLQNQGKTAVLPVFPSILPQHLKNHTSLLKCPNYLHHMDFTTIACCLYFDLYLDVKGQLISKCLFGVFNFFQKVNENTSHSSKNEFICLFFGRIHVLTICF